MNDFAEIMGIFYVGKRDFLQANFILEETQTGPDSPNRLQLFGHCSVVEFPVMDFSGRHYPKDLIVQTVRWYLRFNLSYRDMQEILEERGVEIDHTTPYRWVQEYAPQLEAEHRSVARCAAPLGE